MSQHMNTPLKRIQKLESKVEALTQHALKNNFEDDVAYSVSPIWEADEQLLLRCLRRFKTVMGAYIQQAEIQIDAQKNVNLIASRQSSFYKFVVLQNGDAVLWGDFHEINDLEGMREIFNFLYSQDVDGEMLFHNRCIAKLAYFVPVENGKRWVLSQKGLMVNDHKNHRSIDRSLQNNLDPKIRNLEYKVDQQSKEIEFLKSELGSSRNEIKEILHLLLHSRSS